jgi:hypothetical protein
MLNSRRPKYSSFVSVQVAQLFEEFLIAGARREGEFVEGLIFLIAQMFGIVLWAWNRIQSRLRGLVTCDGLRKGGPESPTDSDQPHPALAVC